ncbi:hypothetical protein LB572_16785 [Mesorhizobium sp. BH1-1-5]|uniref:RipA family octameric membrane protein n=1 Tax=Mesorhizobium sp. BH1-1-5 TaxID=2876661 RepID=UPI001CCB80F9|nr:hypothetical protein [Mesorhizobium sp. BH1-1-5]MBZ9988757.1 hypothetical protein [Mesorhizobium sp. BH1-1-5]
MEDKEFMLIEYQKSAEMYSRGVDIGFSATKNFLILNGILVTAFQLQNSSGGGLDLIKRIQILAPWAGLVLSVVYLLCVSPYQSHLKNCLVRCVEIEEKFGGFLFTRNNQISGRKIHTGIFLYAISLVFIAAWLFFIVLSLKA